jgi:hypothetical protein
MGKTMKRELCWGLLVCALVACEADEGGGGAGGGGGTGGGTTLDEGVGGGGAGGGGGGSVGGATGGATGGASGGATGGATGGAAGGSGGATGGTGGGGGGSGGSGGATGGATGGSGGATGGATGGSGGATGGSGGATGGSGGATGGSGGSGGAVVIEACDLAPESGPCNAAFERWYFDTESRQCLTFLYGGCGGNANNFESLEECVATCGPVVDPCENTALDAAGVCVGADGRAVDASCCAPYDCDQSHAACDRIPPNCPRGQSASILNLCYGPCVDIALCAPSGDEALCIATGGRWDAGSCGHYQCGLPPACQALIPGCDCGPGQTFMPGVGCTQDAACPGGIGSECDPFQPQCAEGLICIERGFGGEGFGTCVEPGCESDNECDAGQRCCYPCGIQGCVNQCIPVDPNNGECPLFP